MNSRSSSVFRTTALERLSSPEQLDQRLQVVSSRAWIALAALGLLLVAVIIWSFLARIPFEISGSGVITTVSQDGQAGEALIYVSAGESQTLQAGLKVRLVPMTFTDNGSSFLHGTVTSVAALPSLPTLFTRDLFPSGAFHAGPLVAVTVALAPEGVPAGMPCRARIVIAEKKPISLVFPVFAQVAIR